jgi:hypothetical protein
MEAKDLLVRIESEGGALTLTPTGLLQHFLPGAFPLYEYKGKNYEGRVYMGYVKDEGRPEPPRPPLKLVKMR